MIKVALPNKGVLFEPTIEILVSCGYRVAKTASLLSSIDTENEVEFYFLRPGDIPLYVANGILDGGITGKDFAAEKGVTQKPVLNLNYGHSQLRAAVPNDSPVATLDEFASLPDRDLVAGNRPLVLRSAGAADRRTRRRRGDLGASSASPKPWSMWWIRGLRCGRRGCASSGEPLFASNAGLFVHPVHDEAHEMTVLRNRLEGKLVAYEYMMVEYDVPEDILQRACEITPGLESPTITKLQREGWYAVKAMVTKRAANRILDELSSHRLSWNPADQHRKRADLGALRSR